MGSRSKQVIVPRRTGWRRFVLLVRAFIKWWTPPKNRITGRAL